jgi:hypothetical protein
MMRDCIVQNVENHYSNTNNPFSEIKQWSEKHKSPLVPFPAMLQPFRYINPKSEKLNRNHSSLNYHLLP